MALRKTFPVSKQATTAARAKILGVAGLLGYALTADVALHILVDGVALAPSRVEGNAFVFELPPAYGEAWLASSHFVPAQMRPNMTDLRRLGCAAVRPLGGRNQSAARELAGRGLA